MNIKPVSKAMHWLLDSKYVQVRNLLRTNPQTFHSICRFPPFPIHSRTPKKENRTRINVIIVNISSQPGRIPVRHTRAPHRIQIINIQIRCCSGVVDEDGGLALRVGGLGGTAWGKERRLDGGYSGGEGGLLVL